MADGVELATDVMRPAGPSAGPAILMRTAYDRTTPASRALQVDAVALAQAGYAVVLQDVRGRFESAGEFVPFVNEGADGSATLEWIRDQSWCNGSVAMAGISYNAFCQLAAAVSDSGCLQAIAPGLGPFDIRTSWLRVGGVDNLALNLSWLVGSLLPTDPRTPDPELLLRAWDNPRATARAGLANPALDDTPAAAWIKEWMQPVPYAGNAGVPDKEMLGDLRIPALVVAGWYDVFAAGSLDLAASLSNAALVAGPWDHSGLPLGRRAGDRDHGHTAAVSLGDLQRAWYDLHLRGWGDQPPPARVFVTGANRWVDYPDWPPGCHRVTLLPAPGGLLVATEAPADTIEVDVRDDDPTPAAGGQVYPWEPVLRSGAFDQSAQRARSDVCSFVGEPLSRSRRFVGKAAATLSVEAEPGAHLFVTVVDVHPDGSAWNVAEGVARTASDGLTEVDLGYLGHQFGPGHAIGVDISGAAWPRFPLVTGLRRIRLGASFVSLPEVPK